MGAPTMLLGGAGTTSGRTSRGGCCGGRTFTSQTTPHPMNGDLAVVELEAPQCSSAKDEPAAAAGAIAGAPGCTRDADKSAAIASSLDTDTRCPSWVGIDGAIVGVADGGSTIIDICFWTSTNLWLCFCGLSVGQCSDVIVDMDAEQGMDRNLEMVSVPWKAYACCKGADGKSVSAAASVVVFCESRTNKLAASTGAVLSFCANRGDPPDPSPSKPRWGV
mmetsp:Transcript_63270/g.135986  ORF Transcript_63270/g.135986 Transcript_63270/m.135986 type:complete len:220 (+) Transcript_63270:791-1450(+)